MMKTTLKIDRKSPNSKGEFLLFVRLRDRLPDGRQSESSISTGIYLLPRHLKNGGISPSTPNYTDKTRVVNAILDDLQRIVSECTEQRLSPNPRLVKKLYEEQVSYKEEKTPQVRTFWEVFDDYIITKKNTSYGYRKTITTLVNHLKNFEEFRGKKLTYDEVVFRMVIFQSEFSDYMWKTHNSSNAYLNKLYGNLSGFLHFSHHMGYIQRKPKLKLESTVDRDEKVYLRTDEVVKLFNSKKWDYSEERREELLKNPHIVIIEQQLEGTRSKEFGGVLRVTNWELVKYIFLFQNSIGCRIGDIPHFKVNDMNFDKEQQLFTWVQRKTSKNVSVPLNDIGGFIFKKFSGGKSLSQPLFPKISTQKFNKQLKLLLRDLKFNRLISRPRKVGSKLVGTEEKPLWELISSHGGRRGFVKNSIDMGNMDYRTIMKLSGHKTFSEFSKYISVTNSDVMKIRGLYKDNTSTGEDSPDEFVKLFNNLNDENKKLVMGLIRSMT